MYNVLIMKSAEALKKEMIALGLSCFIFTFDECCLLNFIPRERAEDCIMLLAMQRAIKSCDQHDFWFLMLDTTTGLGDIYPNADETANSWHLQNDFKPLPPFPFMPFDVMLSSPKNLPTMPLKALQLDNLACMVDQCVVLNYLIRLLVLILDTMSLAMVDVQTG